MNDHLLSGLLSAAIIAAASFAVAIFLGYQSGLFTPVKTIGFLGDDPFRLSQAYTSGALTSVIASFLLNLLAIRFSLPGRGDGCDPIPPGPSPRSSNKENRQGDKATGRGGEP